MTIQDCIKLITAHNGWTFEGSFIQEHPTAPASIGGGGGLRERRYKFSEGGQTIDLNTRSVRWRARTIQGLQAGDKYTVTQYTRLIVS
tara:strand:- start:15 stop:278 length:264 start_codon:yes stop_codon:yes gene_type:complete